MLESSNIRKREENNILVDINVLKPYEGNARKHPKKQLKALSKSIKEYGFNSLVLIDKDYNIVCGHGRVESAKMAGLQEVECKILDNLTDEQIKAFRNIDNRLADMSMFDLELLKIDLEDIKIDLSEFDFNLEGKPEDYKQKFGYDNFFNADFEISTNYWGIPETAPFTEDLSNAEWISFGEKSTIKDPTNTVIHFYIDDYKFESVWKSPNKWLDLFKSCKAVVSPDFSNYTDMAKAQQLWNHYRRQWLAKYWQDNGVNVISSISWAVGQFEGWAIDGIPKGTICATSVVGDLIDQEQNLTDLREILEILTPCKLFVKANRQMAEFLSQHIEFELIPAYEFRRDRSG